MRGRKLKGVLGEQGWERWGGGERHVPEHRTIEGGLGGGEGRAWNYPEHLLPFRQGSLEPDKIIGPESGLASTQGGLFITPFPLPDLCLLLAGPN